MPIACMRSITLDTARVVPTLADALHGTVAAVALSARARELAAPQVAPRDAAGLLAAAVECSANLLVVDPKAFSAVALDRVCGDFSRRDLNAAPAELAAAPAPCACTTHAH
jgi:hypothetical protein